MSARWLFVILVLAAAAYFGYARMTSPEDADQPLQASFSPALKSEIFERELNSILLLWQEGSNKEARSRLIELYSSEFGQIREELRLADPVSTLELEHEYGAVMQRFNRAAEGEEKAMLVKGLLARTLGLIAKLPEPPAPEPSGG